MGIESDVHWGYDLDFDPWPEDVQLKSMSWEVNSLAYTLGFNPPSKEWPSDPSWMMTIGN